MRLILVRSVLFTGNSDSGDRCKYCFIFAELCRRVALLQPSSPSAISVPYSLCVIYGTFILYLIFHFPKASADNSALSNPSLLYLPLESHSGKHFLFKRCVLSYQYNSVLRNVHKCYHFYSFTL